MCFTLRNDPATRMKDYRKALRKWAKCGCFDSMTFCENSSANIQILERDAKGRIDFLSFEGNEYPRHLGKGYGEMNIVRHVLESRAWDADDLVVKITGRYFVRQVDAAIRKIRETPEPDVFCTMMPKPGMVDSRVFAGSVAFLRTHFLPLQHRMNDTEGTYFEHVLFDALDLAKEQGVVAGEFPRTKVIGISGSTGERQNSRHPVEQFQDLRFATRYWILGATKPLRDRLSER